MARFASLSLSWFTVAAAFTLTTSASAQPPREPVVPPRAVPAPAVQGTVQETPARPAEALRSKSILGAQVSIQGGAGVGTVDDIVFTEGGCIDYLVVVDGGRYVMVPWEAARFDFAQRRATLEITRERFREVPTFTEGHWPNVYEPAYRQKIYGYYGLTPGQDRRMERRDRDHR